MNLKKAFIFAKNNNIDVKSTRLILKFILKDRFNSYVPETELSISDEKIFKRYIKKLKQGETLQYITHEQYFYGQKFYVDENVLIPQPDTEILVNEALKIINNIDKNEIKVLDLCTGSGAIAISILNNTDKNVEMYASDISRAALRVTYKNEKRVIGKHKIHLIESNMFEKIPEKFDVIVSNPPYIKTGVIRTLPKDVQNEPLIALDGGKEGLKYYKIIEANYEDHLNKNGVILLEIGFDQKEDVQKLFGESICIKDFAGNDRVIIKKLNS